MSVHEIIHTPYKTLCLLRRKALSCVSVLESLRGLWNIVLHSLCGTSRAVCLMDIQLLYTRAISFPLHSICSVCLSVRLSILHFAYQKNKE